MQPAWDCRHVGSGALDPDDFLGTLHARSTERTRAFLDSLADDEFDAAIIVIGEVHCAGHEAWPDHTVLLEAYRDADTQVAEVVDAVGPDATVLAFSLLGMGTNYDGMFLLDAVVRRLDPVDRSRPIGSPGAVQRGTSGRVARCRRGRFA